MKHPTVEAKRAMYRGKNRVIGNKWAKLAGSDPDLALLGGIIERAILDARQSRNVELRNEAREFLAVCCPDLVDRFVNCYAESPTA